MTLADNVSFFKRCVKLIPEIHLADQDNGYVYAHLKAGEIDWCDQDYLDGLPEGSPVQETMGILGFHMEKASESTAGMSLDLEREKHYTLGRWNGPQAD